MAILHNEIVLQYLILCEGKDTEQFIISYLNSKSLKKDKRFSTLIQTFDFGGITQLSDFIGNLRNMDGFESVSRLMVIRDAETDPDNAVRMIQKALKDNHLPVPKEGNCWSAPEEDGISTSFTLMPTCQLPYTAGALENLCWDILKDEKAVELKNEAKEFVSHIKQTYNTITSHEHKARLHTYFSINERFVTMKVGEAVRAGAFDWESEKLMPLKSLIEEGWSVNAII